MGGGWSLARAARVVAFKDRQPFRQAMFAYLAGHRRTVSAVLAAYRPVQGTPLSTLAIAGYGVIAFLGLDAPDADADLWSVAAYRNEERQFEFVQRAAPELRVAAMRLRPRPTLRTLRATAAAAGAIVRRPSRLGPLWRTVERHDRRDGFLVACRVASTLGYYLRAHRELASAHGQGVRAVLVSSDSNPYAMGVAAAARALGRRVVYITHGHLPEGPPPLDVDLALLDGPALRRVYERAGPVRGLVVFKGAEGELRPMREKRPPSRGLVVGVFASILVDWPSFWARVLEIEAALKPERLIVRLHPNTVIRDPAALRLKPTLRHLEISGGESILTEDAAACDLVVAGNSSCHLTVLRFGVPSVYVPGLDTVPHDFYRFLEDGLIPWVTRAGELDYDAITRFYDAPDWPRRFADYDPAYTIPGEAPPAPSAVGEGAVRQALLSLLGSREARS